LEIFLGLVFCICNAIHNIKFSENLLKNEWKRGIMRRKINSGILNQ